MEMKKLKFKSGDIVKVLPYSWYDFFKNKDGDVRPKDVGIEGAGYYFTANMARHCGVCFEIIAVIDGGYKVYGMHEILEDWMIENEKFNRIQNKMEKSMETKKMILQKAQAFLEDTKFLCKSKEEKISVLSKLNELGVGVIDMKIDCAYMFTIDNNNYLRHTNSIVNWIEENKKEISVSEILSIEIEKTKPKFDPYTLQPFDRVLVRDDEKEEWRCSLYSHLLTGENKYKYQCIYDHYVMCIPYNDETKYLLGTKEDAPEFYKKD